MSERFLLDTNTISIVASGRSTNADRRVSELMPAKLCTSVISYGEVWFGLLRRPAMARLREVTANLLAEIEILPWTRATADAYGQLRAQMERRGKAIAPLDMLIAAHALEVNATLVTSDRAFRFVPGLETEDWTEA